MKNNLIILSFFSSLIVILFVLFCSKSWPFILLVSVISISLSTLFFLSNNKINSTQLSGPAIYLPSKRSARNIAIVSIFLSFLVALIGNQHDYISYSEQWKTILSGEDPWINTTNAYGPIHVAFAPFYGVNRVIPKIIYFLAFIFSVYLASFANFRIKKELDLKIKYLNFISFSFCPFSILTVAVYGNNDALVAGLMLLAIYYSCTFNKKSSVISGMILAIASLVKIYPLIILPAFVFRKRVLDLKFLCSFLSTCLIIIATSYLKWGASIFHPILYASGRQSKHLSFFNFFRTVVDMNLDAISIYLVIVFFLIGFLITQKYRMDLIPSSLILFGFVLSVYKVGNQQYFLFFFLTAPLFIRYLYNVNQPFIKEFKKSYYAWLAFLNFYQIQYHLTCGMREDFSLYFKNYSSLLNLAFSILILYWFAKTLRKDPMIFSRLD